MQQARLTDADIEFIDQLARSAGKLALEMREGVGVHTKSGPRDLVTDADLKISSIITTALAERFPEDLLVSEEDQKPGSAEMSAAKQSELPRRIWLIDPIDGTENYVKNDGQYSTMIGLLVDGVPHYGWIYQPTTKTLFFGGPEHGAYKTVNGAKPQRYKDYASLSTDDPIRLMIGWADRKHRPWVTHLEHVKYVQSDSLGLKIVKILENEADIFVSLLGRVKLWDTAAPAAIALGAGLDVGTVEGAALPYPLPRIQHGSSVIIGRPGSIPWATTNLRSQQANST
jgi:3'(2'), 5'-bisphosphate nucleotidase